MEPRRANRRSEVAETSDRVIIATSHVDSHGSVLAPEALESMVAQIDAAPMRRLLEHDWTIPPDAKAIRGEIEPLPDGALALYVTHSPFELLDRTALPDGTLALTYGSQEDRRPFDTHNSTPLEQIEIGIDPVNFGVRDDMSSFETELRAITSFTTKPFGRKSAVPDPELIVSLPRLIVDHWEMLLSARVLWKVGDKLGDRVGDELAEDAVKAYRLIRSAPLALMRRARPRGAEVTYILVVSGTPEIQFIVRTRLPKVFERAIRFESLHPLLARADELCAAFSATEIQFLFDNRQGWEFNFLLTQSGDVVGTPAAFGRRTKRMQMDASRITANRGE